MISIVDYGMGNLRSVEKAFERIGAPVQVTSEPSAIAEADAVVVPGVGAFEDTVAGLAQSGCWEAVRRAVEAGKPYLGICMGLQVLFTEGEEGTEAGEGTEARRPPHKGFDIIGGRVIRLPSSVKVPHMGWNRVWPTRESPLFEGIAPGSYFYFVHSYFTLPDSEDTVAATCEYGVKFACAVSKGRLYAMQFHPEKSGHNGLKLLKNFCGIVRGTPHDQSGGRDK